MPVGSGYENGGWQTRMALRFEYRSALTLADKGQSCYTLLNEYNSRP